MRINERNVGEVVVLDFVGPLAGWKAAEVVEEALSRGAEGSSLSDGPAALSHGIARSLREAPCGLWALNQARLALRSANRKSIMSL